ncbi:MAG: TIGR03790 family protein [Verrucomicrobiota bacterium]
MRPRILRAFMGHFICYVQLVCMGSFNLRRTGRGGIVAIIVGLAWNLHAGGSGLNTVVIVNQNSSNSVELGNYFCERRQVPPENVLRVSWTGGNVSWTSAEFQSLLLNPLTAMLSARQLSNQIDYVVLSMDFPFQTYNGSVINSTTAALFYGLKTDSGPEWAGITNSYYASEQAFRQAKPASAPGPSFLATMLTAGSLAQAKSMIDQGVNADATFPNSTVLLAKSSDMLRNIRHYLFDNAIFNVRLSPANSYSIARVNADIPSTSPALLGLQTGLAYFSVPANSFVPGAMADSMTSFGGIIFGANDQNTALTFIHAGASGSYGTVTEPQPITDKFPNPQNYFYQSRGFSLAECYYQSLRIPYQGLIVGEPLAAPFQKPATGSWSGATSNAVLTGTRQLTVSFSAADAGHPLQQIDLFIDGKFNRTLTNLPPQSGNVVNLNINNRPIGLVVPANSTIASLADSLAVLINQPLNTNATKVVAVAHGDRIELRSTSPSRPLAPLNLRVVSDTPPGTPVFSTASNTPTLARSSLGTGNLLSTFVTSSRDLFLDSSAFGLQSFTVNGTMQVGTWLKLTVTKTNGTQVNVAVTNQTVSGTPYTLAGDLVNQVNATPALQGNDGVTAEDLSAWFASGGAFNVKARSPGPRAAGAKVQLTASGLALNPVGETNLTANLADLQPRNHLYVTAGATNLTATFDLNTATLADGYHELIAVAYEGSHVQTQTRVTVPVRIQNTTLTATLTLVNLTDPSPVAGTYQIQVTANTNNVSAIKLYSTGGLLGTVNNQSSATFYITGASLGIGLHPFYAIVETPAGRQYRTETRRVRLVGP